MKKVVLLTTWVGISFSLLHAYEPSVYGAGDIDSDQPYGLTATEKNVLSNRQQIQVLNNRVLEQQHRIDGLTTIIEGLNKQIFELKERLAYVEKNSKDDNKTYALLMSLGEMIDQINNNYVSQEDLRIALGGTATHQVPAIGSRIAPTKAPTAPTQDMSEVYREGVKLFSRKSYYAARERFEMTLEHNYKPASSNFYLGEVAYHTGDYQDAIAFYKKSASLYDQASYMKLLYLHTAISLKKIGETEQAKGFFKYVIDHYPNTKAAAIAQQNL